MCSFIVTNCLLNESNIDKVNRYSKNRGPDFTNTYYDKSSGITWLHNLLHITGEKTTQPFVYDDLITTFNGQIYN